MRFRIAGLALIAVLVFWQREHLGSSPPSVTPAPATPAAPVDVPATVAPRALSAAPVRGFTSDRRATQQALTEVGHGWPELDHYVLLKSKALPSMQDRQAMQDYLASSDLEEDARTALKDLSNVGEFARYYVLQAVKAALEQPNGMQRERLKQVLMEVVQIDPFQQTSIPELQNSLAADRLQILMLLKQKFPDAYDELVRARLPAGSQRIVQAFQRNPTYYEQLFR